MKIREIKDNILISDFLAKLGHEPVGKSGAELRYHSPYRNDPTPSFFVNDKNGEWYDHGDAVGGNIIDLAIRVFGYVSVKDVVRSINEMYDGFDLSYLVAKKQEQERTEDTKKHELIKVKPLGTNRAIMTYLENRGILEMAMRTGLVKEVYYDYILDSGDRKRYFGAGWENDSGGWDVRSRYAKVCIGSRGIKAMDGTTGRTNVFEGMIDFQSALSDKVVSVNDTNILLNGLGMYKKGIEYMNAHPNREHNLFLDHGTGGDNITAIFKEHFPSANDRRKLYNGFSDYNEKFCHNIDQTKAKGLGR